VKNKLISIDFPNDQVNNISGEIVFFRPSDKAKDIIVPVLPDASGNQVISSEKLTHGLYRMQISWEFDKVKYYKEGVIVIN
jgi:hypothetical protein